MTSSAASIGPISPGICVLALPGETRPPRAATTSQGAQAKTHASAQKVGTCQRVRLPITQRSALVY
ncbi:MAG TPA: hypothetical protein VFH68_24980 [Polyangia bacterium]|nr:hypothetical protein [Polyangia bacterium]